VWSNFSSAPGHCFSALSTAGCQQSLMVWNLQLVESATSRCRTECWHGCKLRRLSYVTVCLWFNQCLYRFTFLHMNGWQKDIWHEKIAKYNKFETIILVSNCDSV